MPPSIADLIAARKALNPHQVYLAAAERLISEAVAALTKRGCALTKSSIIAVCADPALLNLLVDSPIPARPRGESEGVFRTIEILFASLRDREALVS